MPLEPMRVYADTSVFGGVFDKEFAAASRAFFDEVRAGRFQLVVSPVIELEIRDAPTEVQDFFGEIRTLAETVDVTDEAVRLQQAYLRAAILGPRWEADVLHVAQATVSGCRILVSWNFKHIVHFRKIALYNGVNKIEGFAEIAIHTPQEVVDYENEDV